MILSPARAPGVYHRKHLCVDYGQDEDRRVSRHGKLSSSVESHSVSTVAEVTESCSQSQAATLGRRPVGCSCLYTRLPSARARNEIRDNLRRAVSPQIGNSMRLDLFRGDSNDIPIALNLGIIDIPPLNLVRRKSRPPDSLGNLR